jgi:hypothetical protein
MLLILVENASGDLCALDVGEKLVHASAIILLGDFRRTI